MIVINYQLLITLYSTPSFERNPSSHKAQKDADIIEEQAFKYLHIFYMLYIHPQIRSVGLAFGPYNLLIKPRTLASHVLPTSGRSDTLTYNNGKRILSLPTPLLLVRFSDNKTWKEFIKHNLTQQIFTYLNIHLIS